MVSFLQTQPFVLLPVAMRHVPGQLLYSMHINNRLLDLATSGLFDFDLWEFQTSKTRERVITREA